MGARLQMATRKSFSVSNKAQLNPALLGELAKSALTCEVCLEIEKDVLPNSEGAAYVEAGSFRGRTVGRLDAHFKAHWKDEYELVDLPARKG